MNVSEAILARKSVRAFLDKPVARETVDRILETARHAPSGTNTQPWQVAVLSGEPMRALQQKIVTAFETRGIGKADYNYYPQQWVSPYLERRRACGLQLYQTLGITREDKVRQREQWVANYRAFGAPVMLMFFMDKLLEAGSYMDYGMFLQSVMLAAEDQGLATCPQASVADYPDVVRAELGYDDNYQVLCGIALGYEDKAALVNSYRTPREPLEHFVRYYGL
ncbi:MAG: nitroreductase [Thiolinea sp.]